MIHFLNADGGHGDESDGGRKIGKLKLAMEFGFFDGPAREVAQNGMEFLVAEFVEGHEDILPEQERVQAPEVVSHRG